MTPDEADQVLLTLSATWPHNNMTDATITLWRQRLQGRNHLHTATAVERLTDQLDWWPTWAQLSAGIASARLADGPMWRQLERPGALSADESLGRVKALRATLGCRDTC
jgi:hypothetical protein